MTSHDNQSPELTPDWTCDPRPDPFSRIHDVDVAESTAAGMSRDEPADIEADMDEAWQCRERLDLPRLIELGEN